MNLKLAIKLALAPALLTYGSCAFAQSQIEEIVVSSPIRASQAAALESKRQAFNVKDIISSDTIGRFPDQNLADSLGRLPGLAIERDQGQARFINFRGSPARWTSIAFDGIDVLGADNGRIPRFDSFPSVITSSVEANKAITPDMPGEAVAGFVNIHTFSPFDREGFGLSLEGGAGEQQLGDGDVSKLNGRLSWSNDEFGVVVYASSNEREQVTDNREYFVESVPGGLQVNELDFRSYYVDREDNAYGGTFEYRPSATSRYFVSTLYSEFIDFEERNQFIFEFLDEDTGLSNVGTPLDPTSGYQPVVLAQRALEDGKYDNSTHTSTFGADFEWNDWRVEARLNYTETENNTHLPIPRSVGGAVAASYDVTDVLNPQLNLFEVGTQNPINAADIEFALDLAILVDFGMDTEATKIKFDAERDLELFGADSTLKVGFMTDRRDAEGGSAIAFGGFPADVNIASFATSNLWDTDFENTIGGVYYDNPGLINAWGASVGSLTAPFDPDSLVGIEEDIFAAYAMVTHQFDWGNFTWGARQEYTDYTSSGPDLGIAVSDDFGDFLPSAHLNYDVADDVKLRVSASTGLSRPTYTEWRASAIVDPGERTAVGGNPTLEAETTWGLDASLEWYYAPSSLLSVAAFSRQVDNVIYADVVRVDGGLYIPSEAGNIYDLTGFANGADGELTGIEFNFIGQATDLLPSPFDGFGVSFNHTALDSEFATLNGRRFPLPGTSDGITNASLFYEKWGLSARINYMWRDAWLSGTESDQLAEFWDEQERVDFSVRYILPESLTGNTQVTLFGNVNNLTDEQDLRFIGSPATPNQYEGYGRFWVVGLRLDI